MAILASLEAARISKAHLVPVVIGAGACLAIDLFLGGQIPSPVEATIPLALLGAGLLGATYPQVRIIWPAIGFWIGGPLLGLIWLHRAAMPSSFFEFRAPILLAFLPLWAGDTAAIFAGRAFGKHLLAPAISPKKTWEGSIANLLACMAVATPLATWIGYSWLTGLLCGLACGILGQAGDLFESALKRRSNLKDSGGLLPGHGGLLDRIDSLLCAAPAVALILLR